MRTTRGNVTDFGLEASVALRRSVEKHLRPCDVGIVTREAKRIQQIAGSSYDVRKYLNAETTRNLGRWESRSRPLVAYDPPRLLDVDVKTKLGEDFFLDETIPRHESKLVYTCQ